MQRILKFVAVAQLHAKSIQNRPLATVDGGLIGPIASATSVSVLILPKQLLDQPAAARLAGTTAPRRSSFEGWVPFTLAAALLKRECVS